MCTEFARERLRSATKHHGIVLKSSIDGGILEAISCRVKGVGLHTLRVPRGEKERRAFLSLFGFPTLRPTLKHSEERRGRPFGGGLPGTVIDLLNQQRNDEVQGTERVCVLYWQLTGPDPLYRRDDLADRPRG